MKHTDVLKSEYIKTYVETHKILYSTFNKMISDISFLKATYDLQDDILNYDRASIRYLRMTISESFILRACKCFFDNSGQNVISLMRFKNSILGQYLKEEYRKEIFCKVSQLKIEDKIYRHKFEELKSNCLKLRDGYIAHGLKNADEEAKVNFYDLFELVNNGIDLFHALSFETKGFYNLAKEGDGYDFSKEISYTEKSFYSLIRYIMLSSTQITEISCKKDEVYDNETLQKIDQLIDDINKSKQNS